MIGWRKRVLRASLALVPSPAWAQENATPSKWSGSEVVAGVFDHGANFHPLGDKLVFPKLPDGQIYADSGENGTIDVQIGYRTAPLRFALKPRLTAKAQISTAGRTSFASLGAEWRQHVLRGRLYGQVGIGVTIHDGYRFAPDPFEPGLTLAEAWRRYDTTMRRISFGSRVLFNPNASIGVRLDRRWAARSRGSISAIINGSRSRIPASTTLAFGW